MAGGQVRVRSIEPVAGPAGAEPLAVQVGAHPFVTILCKFSDIAYEPFPTATYRQWTTGTAYPSLDHYWRELSYNQMNASGSVLVGWYILPYPKSYYYDAGTGNLAFDELVTDCTGAADPQVNFPQFYGINLQFNGGFGSNTAYGGSWTLTADGQTKTYGMTWLGGSSLYIFAHEEGHALGLPHSSGPYDQTYDSHWDVMSGLAGRWSAHPVIPVHTISYHKNLLGWIPAARKLTVGPNTSRTITLERLARPGSGNYLMAQIPMANAPGQYYTVEARQRVSYDDSLPGNAVVLHRVDPNPGWDRQARVVDVDNNGDPNDAAAMWTPGETFTDAANGISLTVNAQTATGFQVTITRGASTNSWVTRAPLAKARSAFALALASGRLYAIGGRSNGTNLAAMETYNPATNTWTGKAAVPSPRYDGNGAVANSGLLYLPGGRNAAGTLTNTLYAYNVSANVWSTKAPLPITSGCGASVSISGLVYVLTGCDGTNGFKARLHRYTPSSNTWAARASAPTAHGHPAVGVVNGKLYLAGGRNATGTAIATLHVYDPVTNTWSTKAPMPSARFGAAGQVINGKLYVVGGTNASGAVLATTFVYNPSTNQWSTKAPMPAARTRLGAAALNGLLYAVGGKVTTDLAKVERYTP